MSRLFIILPGLVGCATAELPELDRTAWPAKQPRWSMSRSSGIAARVNDDILTWKDVDDSLRGIPRKNLSAALREAKRRELATMLLFRQAAGKLGIRITGQEIDDELTRRAKAMGGEAMLAKQLRLGGLTMTSYRKQVGQELLIVRVEWTLMRRAFTQYDHTSPGLLVPHVAPEELRRHYDAYPGKYEKIEVVTAFRIGLPFATPREKEAKRLYAGSILRKLAEGTDFEMLKHFFPAGSRAFLNWDRERAKRVLPAEIVVLLFETLKPGRPSGIIETHDAFEIYLVADRLIQKARSFEEAQEDIRRELYSRRMKSARERLKRHLVERAYFSPPELFPAPDEDEEDTPRF